MKYRIVTNNEWFEIECKDRFWPFWFRHKPNQRFYGYKPIDWSKFRFKTVELAEKRIQELKASEELGKWKVVK